MYSVTLRCEIREERTLTVKLPDAIQPGTHEVMVIVNEPQARPSHASSEELMRFAGAIPGFAEVDGLAVQRAVRDEWS